MSEAEKIASNELLELSEDLVTIIKNKLLGNSNLSFFIALIDTQNNVYNTESNVCKVCVFEMLEMEIKQFKLEHE